MTTEKFTLPLPTYMRLLRKLAREMPTVDVEVPVFASAPCVMEVTFWEEYERECRTVQVKGIHGMLWVPCNKRGLVPVPGDEISPDQLRGALRMAAAGGDTSLLGRSMMGAVNQLAEKRAGKEEARRDIEKFARENFAVVDGVIYRRTEPPRWITTLVGHYGNRWDPRDQEAVAVIQLGQWQAASKVNSCHYSRRDVANELVLRRAAMTRGVRPAQEMRGSVVVLDDAYDVPVDDLAQVVDECWEMTAKVPYLLVNLDRAGVEAWADMKDAAASNEGGDTEAKWAFVDAFESFVDVLRAHRGADRQNVRHWLNGQARRFSARFEVEKAQMTHAPAAGPAV